MTTAPELPVVIDPFSLSGDFVAGATPNEIALNLAKVVQLSRSRPLRHQPQDLRKVFRGCKLSEDAKAALRKADASINAALSHPLSRTLQT